MVIMEVICFSQNAVLRRNEKGDGMIKLKDLTKRYGEVLAVDRLNLEVQAGQVFGFLGPNGAGKTTTIKLMSGLLKPTAGTVELNGIDIQKDPIKAKQTFGLVVDQPFVYEKLTGYEFLRFVGQIYKLDPKLTDKRIGEFLELFELTNWKDELIESYSHGMKQKIVIAAALIHDPKILIVDEPMVGLDPKSARLLKNMFRELAKRGTAIFMSTHVLEIAEKVCDQIGIIHQGSLLAMGTIDELRSKAKTVHDNLEDLFLELTGGEVMKEFVKVLGD